MSSNGDPRKLAIKNYHDRKRWSLAKHEAMLELFQQAHERIRRSKRGWSAISDRELTAGSWEERQRARKARNKREERARKAVKPTPGPAQPLLTLEEFTARLASLKRWLALPGHRQRHLRGRKADIMRTWVLRRDCMRQYGREPTLAEFADTFVARFEQPMTRQMAQKRLALLALLEAVGGPFASAF